MTKLRCGNRPYPAAMLAAPRTARRLQLRFHRQPVLPASLLLLLLAVSTGRVPCIHSQQAPVVQSLSTVCSLPAGNALAPDMHNCSVRGALKAGFAQSFAFLVRAGSTFDIMLELRAIRGDVDLFLDLPDGQSYASENRPLRLPTMDSIVVPRTYVASNPGSYTVTVRGFSDEVVFKLQVSTPTASASLVASEVALLRSVWLQCCDMNDNEISRTCQVLSQATDPARAAGEDDMCQQAPSACDSDGHLTKLVLVGDDQGNFLCSALPAEFGQFSRLQTLDLSNNFLVGTLGDVTAIFRRLPALQQLYLTANLYSGPTDCGIFATPKLQVLWLNFNALKGQLPACAFASKTLQELVVSDNFFYGTLPQIPVGSPLQLLDISTNGDHVTVGFSGVLPRTLANAGNLRFLDASNNNLTGAMPDLSSSIETVRASNNQLGGPLPSSLQSARNLQSLSAGGNLLAGSIPRGILNSTRLQYLQLQGNALTGVIPPAPQQNPHLAYVDLSDNSLTGGMPSTLASMPNLESLNVAANRLEGDLSAFAGQLYPGNRLSYLNASGNELTGALPDRLGLLALFTGSTQDVDTSIRPVALDVGLNRLTGTFPMWLFTAFSALPDVNLRALQVVVAQQQGGQLFTCPPALTNAGKVPTSMVRLEFLYAFQCNSSGSQIYVTDALYTSISTAPGRLPPPSAAPLPPPGLMSAQAHTSKGSSTMVYVAIGCGVGGVLLALFAVFFFVRYRRHCTLAHAAERSAGGLDTVLNSTAGSITASSQGGAPSTVSSGTNGALLLSSRHVGESAPVAAQLPPWRPSNGGVPLAGLPPAGVHPGHRKTADEYVNRGRLASCGGPPEAPSTGTVAPAMFYDNPLAAAVTYEVDSPRAPPLPLAGQPGAGAGSSHQMVPMSSLTSMPAAAIPMQLPRSRAVGISSMGGAHPPLAAKPFSAAIRSGIIDIEEFVHNRDSFDYDDQMRCTADVSNLGHRQGVSSGCDGGAPLPVEGWPQLPLQGTAAQPLSGDVLPDTPAAATSSSGAGSWLHRLLPGGRAGGAGATATRAGVALPEGAQEWQSNVAFQYDVEQDMMARQYDRM